MLYLDCSEKSHLIQQGEMYSLTLYIMFEMISSLVTTLCLSACERGEISLCFCI